MGVQSVIGCGQVGQAVAEVLGSTYCVKKYDGAYWTEIDTETVPHGPGGVTEKVKLTCDVMHVCFPYGERFVNAVTNWQSQLLPAYTVIHSTVPLGTSRRCGATHSPVIGMHPNLAASLLQFTKFVAGPEASYVAGVLRRAGLRVYVFDSQETTELMKLASTTFYGMCIQYTRHLKQLCAANYVPFEAWTLWTKTYNEGYRALGRPEYTRPELIPLAQGLGGHCVLANCDLLDSPFADFVQGMEDKLNG